MRANKRSAILNSIKDIENDISNNVHIELIEKLKTASEKLNDVQLQIDQGQDKGQSGILSMFQRDFLSQLKSEAAQYQQEIHDHITNLGIDTNPKDWNLGKEGDKVAKDLALYSEKLQSIHLAIETLKKSMTKKRNLISDVRRERWGLNDEITSLEKQIKDEDKWSAKAEKMRGVIDTLNGAAAKLCQ